MKTVFAYRSTLLIIKKNRKKRNNARLSRYSLTFRPTIRAGVHYITWTYSVSDFSRIMPCAGSHLLSDRKKGNAGLECNNRETSEFVCVSVYDSCTSMHSKNLRNFGLKLRATTRSLKRNEWLSRLIGRFYKILELEIARTGFIRLLLVSRRYGTYWSEETQIELVTNMK